MSAHRAASQKRSAATRANIAPSTSTLSASGSRKAPERVRAVAAGERAVDAVGDGQRDPERHRAPTRTARRRIISSSTGESSSRTIVTALAGVISADGPKRSLARARSRTDAAQPARPRGRGRAAAVTVDGGEGADRERGSGTAMTPSISGASRCERAMPGRSTSTSTREPTSSSRLRAVMASCSSPQLGQPLGHEPGRDRRRRGRRRRCPSSAE